MSDHEPVRDSKTTLYQAAQAAIAERQAKAEADRQRLTPQRRRRLGLLAAVSVVGAALLALQPTWLAGPKTLPPEPPAIAAASVRLTLLRERERVLDFQRRTGRLPQTLTEAGVTAGGLHYQLDSSLGFVLTGYFGDSVIAIGPSDTPGAFLGTGLRAIRERGRP